jgi:hypothetical protein
MDGRSVRNHGVVGRTDGRRLPREGDFDEWTSGVRGISSNGFGVHGSSFNHGVVGISTGISGVFGQGRDGVTGKGERYGVDGEGERGGVRGVSPRAGVEGLCTGDGLGVKGQTLSGRGVWGLTDEGKGVEGMSLVKGSGVFGFGVDGYGVAGQAGNGYAGGFFGDLLVTGDLNVTGAKSAVVPTGDGSLRRLYTLESPESWFEDFGEAELVDGKAVVRLAPDFAEVVAGGFQVFLTPYGDSNGLFVSSRQPGVFEVTEQQGGQSSLRFGYRIVAKRADIQAPRMPVVPPPPEAPLVDPAVEQPGEFPAEVDRT